MMDKVGTYSFVAEPFHVDFKGQLTMGVLGNHLLNCAGFHSTERGFGIAYLNQHHYTWVLSRLAIEMERMPHEYESFTVDTWVENVYKLFTDRNFAIRQNGKAIGYARSVWAMINLETRKPEDLLTLHGGAITDYIENSIPCPIEKPGRIKVNQEKPVATFTATYSDIDINGHLNSVRYIEHIMDQFPLDYLRTRQVKRFEMAYSAEAYYGDCIHIYRQETIPGLYELELRKGKTTEEKGEVCVKSKLSFIEETEIKQV